MKTARAGIITPQSIKKKRWELVRALGRTRKRGSVLDVLELEGSYALENSSFLFENISVGDRLAVCDSADTPDKNMLSVKTESGLTVGFLPAGTSLLLRLMLSKGCRIFCYIEYKDYTNSLLTICVSLYASYTN